MILNIYIHRKKDKEILKKLEELKELYIKSAADAEALKKMNEQLKIATIALQKVIDNNSVS